MAMLGLIHKVVLGQAHPDFSRFFPLSFARRQGRTSWQNNRHAYTLVDDRNSRDIEVWKRSAAGLIPVYCALEQEIVMVATVSEFQTGLQKKLKERAARREPRWEKLSC